MDVLENCSYDSVLKKIIEFQRNRPNGLFLFLLGIYEGALNSFYTTKTNSKDYKNSKQELVDLQNKIKYKIKVLEEYDSAIDKLEQWIFETRSVIKDDDLPNSVLDKLSLEKFDDVEKACIANHRHYLKQAQDKEDLFWNGDEYTDEMILEMYPPTFWDYQEFVDSITPPNYYYSLRMEKLLYKQETELILIELYKTRIKMIDIYEKAYSLLEDEINLNNVIQRKKSYIEKKSIIEEQNKYTKSKIGHEGKAIKRVLRYYQDKKEGLTPDNEYEGRHKIN